MDVVIRERLTGDDLHAVLAFAVAYAEEKMWDHNAASARALAARIISAHGRERLYRWADYVDPHTGDHGRSDREAQVKEIDEWAAGQVARLRRRGVHL